MDLEDVRQMATKRVMGMDRDLPAHKFFEPTPKFLSWMAKHYAGSLIYDVGAGCGHVTKALLARKLKVLALDINSRDEQDAFVMIADGEDYCYNRGTVVMVCRPCHGQFVERVIDQAVSRGVTTILYVGLERNVDADLGQHLAHFKKALTGAGQEGEFVLRWTRRVK